MIRDRLASIAGVALGFLAALLLWSLLLGAHVQGHGPGLWTLRFERLLSCGVDYNGPPYSPAIKLWVTCGEATGQVP